LILDPVGSHEYYDVPGSAGSCNTTGVPFGDNGGCLAWEYGGREALFILNYPIENSEVLISSHGNLFTEIPCCVI